MHQGWPKFVANLWMGTAREGLAAVAYGPSSVTAPVRGVSVNIAEDTEYPFRDTIRMTVNPASPVAFPLELRIPAWASEARVLVNAKPVSPVKAGSFLTVDRSWKKGDRIEIHFPMSPRLSRWYNNAVTVDRGPLVYSLRIGEDWRKVKDHPRAPDWGIHPTTPWNYGLVFDPDHPSKSFEAEERQIGPYPFSADGAPVLLKVKARRIPSWTIVNDSAAPPPQSPVKSTEPEEIVTLIPYGSAKLRVTELPQIAK